MIGKPSFLHLILPVLAVGAGTGLALAFLVFAFGRHSETWAGLLRATWPYLRWPLGLVVATLALGGVEGHDVELREGMDRTLEAIKREIEQPARR